MGNEILYCYYLNGIHISRIDITNFRRVICKTAKQKEVPCYVILKSRASGNIKIPEEDIDVCIKGKIYSFNPSFHYIANIFIKYINDKKVSAAQQYKRFQKIERALEEKYIKN